MTLFARAIGFSLESRDPSSRLSSLKRGNFAADTCAVEGNAAEHLFDAADAETPVAADDAVLA